MFIDHFLVEELNGAALQLHRPTRREVVFQVQHPQENACTACYNLTRDDDRILMYYRGYYPIGERQADWAESQTAHLATSRDGVHFERPELDLIEADGSTANNMVYRGYEAHNFCVFRDDNPAADPAQRFKAVGGSAKNNLHGFCSADGLHWERLQEEPLDITGAFDSVNVALWDPHIKQYRVFSRYFDQVGARIRAIQSCTSDDFVHWSAPEPHRYAEGVPLEHFYTNATTPCPGAEHILLSFPMRFVPEREKDIANMDYPGPGVSDAVFISSRDGLHWDRSFMEAWIRPGLDRQNWTHRNCTPAPGIVETAPDEWSIYISEHYGWSDNRLRRVAVRPHGFASVSAGHAGGEVLTRPLIFAGDELRLNYSTSAPGSIRVEVQDEAGRVQEGFALDAMDPLYGDELDAPISWKGGDLAALTGRPMRLRIALKDADLFALRAV